MTTNWNSRRIGELAIALPEAEDGEAAWLTWVARARPFFKTQFPEHVQEFDGWAGLSEPRGRILATRRKSPAQVEALREKSRHDRAHALMAEIRRQRPVMMGFLQGVDAVAPMDEVTEGSASTDPLPRLLRLLDRFPLVARQLGRRHDARETLKIQDEYDVQDLLHAVLLIEFDDVRPEDPAPSQGGTSSRVDFLLFQEKIVIEVKKTRAGLGNRELTRQINDDVGHYARHPDCARLVCFVFDPDHLVKNPKGFETDHTRPHGELNLITVVRPH